MKTEAVRKAALQDLAERDADERCMAIHAVSLLDALGFDDEQARGQWRKLEGRPCGRVREWTKEARQAKPEMRQHLLTEFAKVGRA